MAVELVYIINQPTPVIITGGFVPTGAYKAGTTYAIGDSVSYMGSSYVMYSLAIAGTLPTNTTYWQVIANIGATGPTGEVNAYRLSFTNSSLVSGILSVNHNLDETYVNVQVFDNNNNFIVPDNINLVDANDLTVDLLSYGTITGTYNLIVTG